MDLDLKTQEVESEEYGDEVEPPWILQLIAFGLCCEAIFPKDDELQLDMDDKSIYESICFTSGSEWIANEIIDFKWWSSKSGKGYHVVYTLSKCLSVPERIALQMSIGSDMKRESLSLKGFLQGKEQPIVLFKPLYKLLTKGN